MWQDIAALQNALQSNNDNPFLCLFKVKDIYGSEKTNIVKGGEKTTTRQSYFYIKFLVSGLPHCNFHIHVESSGGEKTAQQLVETEIK